LTVESGRELADVSKPYSSIIGDSVSKDEGGQVMSKKESWGSLGSFLGPLVVVALVVGAFVIFVVRALISIVGIVAVGVSPVSVGSVIVSFC